MNKLVKSVKKFTKKMTLTHLLVALLVVALVVAVIHRQSNQENFSWWSWYQDYWRRQQEAMAKIIRAAQLTKQYTRANWERTYMPTQRDWAPAKPDSINKWIETQKKYLKLEDNGEKPLQNGTWQTKCAWRGKIDQSIRPVDLTIESNNLKTIGEADVYKDLDFKKCQAICDFHSAPETAKGQWEGGCTGFNITFERSGNRDVKCVFYSKSNSYNPPTSSISGLTRKLNKKMRFNWNKNAKAKQPKPNVWWGLKYRSAIWTYWPRKESHECQ